MAWTTPMTATEFDVFFAADFNTHVRDNLLETAPAKASSPGALFVTSAANQITEYRYAEATVTGTGNRANTAYGDADDVTGPEVTLTTGTRALVAVGCELGNSTSAGGGALASFEVSGASTVSAADQYAFGDNEYFSTAARVMGSRVTFLTSLTAGSNTFTMKYRTDSAGNGIFLNRHIAVLPL